MRSARGGSGRISRVSADGRSAMIGRGAPRLVAQPRGKTSPRTLSLLVAEVETASYVASTSVSRRGRRRDRRRRLDPEWELLRKPGGLFNGVPCEACSPSTARPRRTNRLERRFLRGCPVASHTPKPEKRPRMKPPDHEGRHHGSRQYQERPHPAGGRGTPNHAQLDFC